MIPALGVGGFLGLVAHAVATAGAAATIGRAAQTGLGRCAGAIAAGRGALRARLGRGVRGERRARGGLVGAVLVGGRGLVAPRRLQEVAGRELGQAGRGEGEEGVGGLLGAQPTVRGEGPGEVLDEEIGVILDMGVELRLGARVDSLAALLDEGYDAVFIGLGHNAVNALGVEGEDAAGVLNAVDFIERIRQEELTGLPVGTYTLSGSKDGFAPSQPLEVPVIEDYIEILTPDGRPKDRFSILEAFHSSPYAFLLVSPQQLPSDRQAKPDLLLDMLHTNHIEIFDGSLADRSPIYAEGNVLISMRTINTIAIVDPRTRDVLWAWGPTNLHRQHHRHHRYRNRRSGQRHC